MGPDNKGEKSDRANLGRVDLQTFLRIREIGYNTLDLLASGILFVIMGVTVLNAIGRYVFNQPISGTIEFVEIYLMVAVIWFGAIPLQLNQSNITLDILSRKFSELTDSVVKAVFLPLITLVMSIASYGAFNRTANLFEVRATTTGSVQFPTYISWGMLTAALILLTSVLLFQWIVNIRKIIKLLQGSEVTHD